MELKTIITATIKGGQVSILENTNNGKFFVLSMTDTSKYFFTIQQCCAYIKEKYNYNIEPQKEYYQSKIGSAK